MRRRVNKEEKKKKEKKNKHLVTGSRQQALALLQTQLTDVSGTGTPQLQTQAGNKTQQVYCSNNCM